MHELGVRVPGHGPSVAVLLVTRHKWSSGYANVVGSFWLRAFFFSVRAVHPEGHFVLYSF